VAAARQAWRERQPRLNPARLVFIDETWATTNMTRLRGRCQRGQRLVAAVPHGHWRTSTFVAGLRTTGLGAPLVLDGAMNGDAFRAYSEQILAPTLAPGDIVIMDNLGSHKVAGVREAIEARGASLIYLPPYSPDLNPIEQSFAKLKALIRKAAALRPSGTPSEISSAASPRRNAQTTSPRPAMSYLIGKRSNARRTAPWGDPRAQHFS
jgi:transposase